MFRKCFYPECKTGFKLKAFVRNSKLPRTRYLSTYVLPDEVMLCEEEPMEVKSLQ